jgi:hypothetical protein
VAAVAAAAAMAEDGGAATKRQRCNDNQPADASSPQITSDCSRLQIHPSEGASVAAAAASAASGPLPDAPECVVCKHSYECDEAKQESGSRIPRTLPCSHSACSGCLLRLLTATPGSVATRSR